MAVRAYWLDSQVEQGWKYDMDQAGDSAKICSIGYVVNTTPEAVVLTTSIGSKGGALSPLSIPWKAIEKLEKLGKSWDR